MTQWIDQPGPDDDPVVRVEDDLGGGERDPAQRERPGGVQDVHSDATRDRGLYSGQDAGRRVDDDAAQGLTGDQDESGQQDGSGEPAKRHGDPLLPRGEDPAL